MIPQAIISDIHANLEALEAVLADIAQFGVAEILCLGDVVGYGPNPVECTEIVRRRCKLSLCGNHDNAVIHGTYGFSHNARDAVEYTRRLMQPGLLSLPPVRSRWRFIRDLPRSYKEGEVLYVHASPRDPINEYILAQDVHADPDKLRILFDKIDKLCFVGHTHVPGIFTPEPSFKAPADADMCWEVAPGKAIVNVGSVGQPRDGDNRACYVVFTGSEVRFRRVEYDFARTIAKIQAAPGLAGTNAARLEKGS